MKNTERRQSVRYNVPGKTIAISPHNLGQVLDISMQGCSVKYIGGELHFKAEECIDILMKQAKDNGFYIEQLPIQIAWEDSPDFSAFSSIVVKRVGMKFHELTEPQQQQLNQFITQHGFTNA